MASLAEIESLEETPFRTRAPERSTFERLSSAAKAHPDRLALRFLEQGLPDEPARDLTYAQFFGRIVQAANLFHALGVDGNSSVSLLLPLLPETFIAMFGAQAAGMANPINFLLEPQQIAALLREARCRVLLAPDPDVFPGVWPKVEAIRRDVPTLRSILRVGGPRHRPDDFAGSFEAELDRHPSDRLTAPRDIAPEDVASLFHTGGTTAVPKLARHTHGGLVLQSWSNAQVWRPGPDEVYLSGLPPFHVGGANCVGLSPLSQGATVVLLTAAGYRNPNVIRNFWALAERFRATVLPMVPTSWGAVMNVPSEGYDLSSVRLCHAGGAAMPIELAHTVSRRLQAPVVEGWGMTELHGFGSMNPAAGECRIGSVGLRTPYTELVVAAVSEGRIEKALAPGEIGRVLVRGDQLFGGYLNEAHNQGAWVDPPVNESRPDWSRGGRWLDTGDLGRFDADGYLWLTGRSKDVIIRGGHNIDPLIIEDALYRHEAVEIVAAVGRPDAYAGELPVAFVQLKPGAEARPEDLQGFARERIPERAANPVEVIVLAKLPLTGVGKIFKPELRHIAARLELERALNAQASTSAPIRVDVASHPHHGTLASVRLPEGMTEEEIAAVRRLLDAYPLRYEIVAGAASAS
jgi:fatty-acyl-CoA synthase